VALVLAASTWAAARAETPAEPTPADTSASAPASDIIQTSCTSCGGCGGGDRCDWWCRPDASPYCQPGCYPDTCLGKCLHGFYECLCCKDPCYDPPKWLAVADAGFFLDAARPITQSRIRVDVARNLRNPDRAEYIWARIQPGDCQLVIPSCRPVPPRGKGVNYVPSSVDFDELSFYQEIATPRASFFIEVPYRHIEADLTDICPPAMYCNESGFTDINLGTKSLLCDCELMQFTFQFKTYIPTGSFGKGFSTGHVSLEPALLLNLNLGGSTYLQVMSAYWIPIGGDDVFQANIWHNHFSLNHILATPCKGFQVIGTIEFNEWTIYGGAYTVTDRVDTTTDPDTIFGESAATTIASAGPGIRLVFCDRVDIGVGSAFGFTGSKWFEDVIRSEIRWRY
jgi:hypothetical protein